MLPSSTQMDNNVMSMDKQRKILPLHYQLHDNDVFCGRGSHCFNHPGNGRFREIVSTYLPRYHNALNKFEKSSILHEVVMFIRSTSPGAGFVMKDVETGRYYEVGDNHAREKTSQAFRDATQGKYKSSRLSKLKKSTTNRFDIQDQSCETISSSTSTSANGNFVDEQIIHGDVAASQPIQSQQQFHRPNIVIGDDDTLLQRIANISTEHIMQTTDIATLEPMMNNNTNQMLDVSNEPCHISTIIQTGEMLSEKCKMVNNDVTFAMTGNESTREGCHVEGKRQNDTSSDLDVSTTDERTFDLLLEFTEKGGFL